MSEVVNVEMKISRSIWKAICKVAEKVCESPDERAELYMRQGLKCDADDCFSDDVHNEFLELTSEIQMLLKE